MVCGDRVEDDGKVEDVINGRRGRSFCNI